MVAYVYGYQNFIDDLVEMTGSKVNANIGIRKYPEPVESGNQQDHLPQIMYKLQRPLAIFYMGLSPLVILIILIASWVQYEPLSKVPSSAPLLLTDVPHAYHTLARVTTCTPPGPMWSAG